MRRQTTNRSVLAAILSAAATAAMAGCTDRPEPRPPVAPSRRVDDFRVIRFAGEKVVVPFRSGLEKTTLPAITFREAPKAGDRVALGDPGKPGVGEGQNEVFLALDLEALQFYHSTPGPDQLGRFRELGDAGRLFVVARGTIATVARIVNGELPEGLKAVELALPGLKGGPAWVSEPFIGQPGDDPKAK